MADICIRPSNKEDCPAILKLIQELADYENLSDGPKLDLKTFEEDGFGDNPFYKCFVAENMDTATSLKEVVGYALYHFKYSTFEGKSIYMEDLYVTPKHRKNGIGGNLWKSVVKEGLERGCCRTDFSVLGWNVPSIEFYKKKGAVDLTLTEDWHYFRLHKDQMVSFAQS